MNFLLFISIVALACAIIPPFSPFTAAIGFLGVIFGYLQLEDGRQEKKKDEYKNKDR